MMLAIDGTNWVHALWHAMQGASTADVLSVFRRRIGTVAKHSGAAVVLVAFDRRSFRHDLLAGYKAQRAAKEPALEQLLAAAPEEAAKVGLPVYQDGYEADDLLATAAAIAVSRGDRSILCSPDKDLWQCLAAKQVSCLLKVKIDSGEIKDATWWTEAQLYDYPDNPAAAKRKEPYRLRPWQWAEYQALVGESGDNVPGCPKWGPETSGAALQKFGSIEAMLRKPWEIPCTNPQRTTLQNWAKSPTGMAVTLQCVRLRTDCAAVWDALR
jgi:DNA polymerase-1